MADANIAGLAVRPRSTGGRDVADGGILVADRPGSLGCAAVMGRIAVSGVRGYVRTWGYLGAFALVATDSRMLLRSLLLSSILSVSRSSIEARAATLCDTVFGMKPPLAIKEGTVVLSEVECDPLLDKTACDIVGAGSHVRLMGDVDDLVGVAAAADRAYLFSDVGFGGNAWPAAAGTGVSDGLGSHVVRL